MEKNKLTKAGEVLHMTGYQHTERKKGIRQNALGSLEIWL